MTFVNEAAGRRFSVIIGGTTEAPRSRRRGVEGRGMFNGRSRSSKVVDFMYQLKARTVWCYFLLVISSNFGLPSPIRRLIGRKSKICLLYSHLTRPSLGMYRVEFLGKPLTSSSRDLEVYEGEDFVTIACVVLIDTLPACDGRADRRTDISTVAMFTQRKLR